MTRFTAWRRLSRMLNLPWNTEGGLVRIAAASVLLLLLIFSVAVVWSGNRTAGRWGIWVTGVASFATMTLVLLTYLTVRTSERAIAETRAARLAQSRPQVLVSFERDGKALNVVIEHHGGGPARNVRFDFKPPLKNHEDEDIGAKPPFSTGVPMMAPRFRHVARFADFNAYALDWLASETPEGVTSNSGQFAVTIILNDPLANDERYAYSYKLDVAHLMESERQPWRYVTRADIEQMPGRAKHSYLAMMDAAANEGSESDRS